MSNAISQFIIGIRAIGMGLWTTLKHVFRKPVTIQYGYAPRWSKQQVRPIAPRYRGQFTLIRDPESGELRCTACKLCAQACPGRCIEVEGENRKVTLYNLDMTKCLFCGLCVEACNFEALGMYQQGVAPTSNRKELLLTLETIAQPAGKPMPGVLPSNLAGDLRPGRKPFVPKSQKAAAAAEGAPAAKAEPATE